MDFQQIRLATPTTLSLQYTLPSGQAFRWKTVADNTWRGVIGSHIITLRQQDPSLLEWQASPDIDPVEFNATLSDYFQLQSVDLDNLFTKWGTSSAKSASGADINADFAKVAILRHGLRLIRQKPSECTFSFICSQNNNIKRIAGMIDRLCVKYGTKLAEIDGESYHAFPTIPQLESATEEELQALGFGYRAKYIVGSVKHIQAKGGAQWLDGLRGIPRAEAKAELLGLPGVGPKVADCISLFSLDHLDVVPVDTHVWKMANRYIPEIAGATTPNPRVFDQINEFFIQKFGNHAGWAHTILFSAAITKELNVAPKTEKKASTKKRVSKEDPEYTPDSKKLIE